MPPMPVEIITLTAKPVEQTTRVRRHGEVAPVDDHPAAGRRLPHAHRGAVGRAGRAPAPCCSRSIRRRQQAAVASLESQRPREADVEFARQQVQRNKTLLTPARSASGRSSSAQTAVQTSEAQLKALDEQIRQQRSELGYYRVTAPIAGIVGDIPVRVGDRVTRRRPS